jgi:hypothetical protein
MSVILNRGESATVLAALRLLPGDRVRSKLSARPGGLSDEIDAEYDRRFDANEESVRELIDRIDEMSPRGGAFRCSGCTASRRDESRDATGCRNLW